MIDLFLPPKVRKRAVSRIEPDPESTEIAHGRIRKEGPRSAYYRKWHAENRAKRLQQMRDRYEANKQEYIDRAKAWCAAHPELTRQIKRANGRRARLKKKLGIV